MDSPATYQCPQCDATIEILHWPTMGLATCESCGTQFYLAADENEDELAGLPADFISENELDRAKIDRIAKLSRANYRSRSHAIIAAFVCGMSAVEFALFSIRHFRSEGATMWVRAGAIATLFTMAGTIWFVRRCIEIHREVRAI